MLPHFGCHRVEHLFQPPVIVHLQHTVLPRAQPSLSVLGLEHPQSAEVLASVVQSGILKLVAQAVQPQHARLGPVGHCPHLVLIIYIYLCHGVSRQRRLISLGLARLHVISPHALLHRGGPEAAVLVDRQAGHLRTDVHRQLFHQPCLKVQKDHAPHGACVDAPLACRQGRNILVVASLRDPIGFHVGAVVAA